MSKCLVRRIASCGALLCLMTMGCFAQTPRTPDRPLDAANATYSGIYDEPVTLNDGLYEGDPVVGGSPARQTLRLVEGLQLTEDFDEDGTAEVAVLVTENSGGTGTFLYVAVFKYDGDEWRNADTELVGDRVQVKRFYRNGPKIGMDVVQSGPNDAACCPTQNATRRWLFEGGQLRVSGETITGILSFDDISGVEWRLTSINGEEAVPDTISITLTIDGDSANGKSGCNSYTGTITEGEKPGSLSFGPIGGTKMLCPEPAMEWETRYLTALQSATQFSFVAGNLEIGGVVDNDYVSLRFSR